MSKKGGSRKAELQRRRAPSTARAARADLDGRHDSAIACEPAESRPLWEILDIRVSVVAKGTQTPSVDGEIGDLGPPPAGGLRRRKKHATFRQWIGYASQTRRGLTALHGLIEALKRVFGV